MAPTVMRRCSTPMISRLLPVNSSLPAMSTMERPAGKIKPVTTFATDGFSIVAVPAVDATPASATKTPARHASKNIRSSGSCVFVSQAPKVIDCNFFR